MISCDTRAKVKCAFVWAALIPVVLVIPLQGRCGEISDSEVRQHLDSGLDYFRKAVDLDRSDPEAARDYYLKSILHLERIVEEGGIRNGKLFYNIGNAYFRLGDLGRAILNYKRAALYIPNDVNLRQNLEHARSRRIDRVDSKEREKVFKTLFFLHYDIPSRVRFMIFICSFALAWVFAAILLFIHRGGIRIVLIITSVISAVFFLSLVVEAVNLSRRPEGVIVVEEVVARKGDADTYRPSFKEPLHSGTEFNLVESRSGWLHIELESGARCWIPSDSGEFVLD